MSTTDSERAGFFDFRSCTRRLTAFATLENMTHQKKAMNGQISITEHNLCVLLVTKGTRPVVIREIWENPTGELSRPDGPALLERTDSGVLLWEEWWQEGRKHRASDRPAVTDYDEEGSGAICVQEWWKHGKRHRLNAPARIWFDPSTKEVIEIEWWVGGYNIQPEEMTGVEEGTNT